MPSVTDISVNGLNFIRGFEGRALRAYQDEVGVWTIGFGITNYDKGIGFKVGPGVTITAEQAEALLYSSIRRNYLPEVEHVLDVDKCQHPQGALDGGLSFHYNCGAIAKATWPKALMRGDLDSARQSLMSWNKAGGKVLNGLTRRRAGEWDIITKEDYGHLTGPSLLDDRGRPSHQAGALLTALPGHAGEIVPGNVSTTGIPTPTSPAPGVLKIGATGPEVEQLQTDLSKLGYAVPITGTFDPITQNAVTSFQQSHTQLTADGTVGPATRAAITRAIAMNEKVKTVIKTAAPAAPAAAGLWHFLGTHAAEVALIVGVVVLVAGIAYVLIRHRHEAMATVNGALGRVVA